VDKDERISIRAHRIWEREGRKHGQHERHWEEARREIEAEEAATGGDAKSSNIETSGVTHAGGPAGERSRAKAATGGKRRNGPAAATAGKKMVRGRAAKPKSAPDGRRVED